MAVAAFRLVGVPRGVRWMRAKRPFFVKLCFRVRSLAGVFIWVNGFLSPRFRAPCGRFLVRSVVFPSVVVNRAAACACGFLAVLFAAALAFACISKLSV